MAGLCRNVFDQIQSFWVVNFQVIGRTVCFNRRQHSSTPGQNEKTKKLKIEANWPDQVRHKLSTQFPIKSGNKVWFLEGSTLWCGFPGYSSVHN